MNSFGAMYIILEMALYIRLKGNLLWQWEMHVQYLCKQFRLYNSRLITSWREEQTFCEWKMSPLYESPVQTRSTAMTL